MARHNCGLCDKPGHYSTTCPRRIGRRGRRCIECGRRVKRPARGLCPTCHSRHWRHGTLPGAVRYRCSRCDGLGHNVRKCKQPPELEAAA